MNCIYCSKECKNFLSLRCHEIRCKLNPDRKVYKTGPKKGHGSNQFTKAAKLGLEKPIVSDETRKKHSKSAKEQNAIQWTDERRAKHSQIMKDAVLRNPESYSKCNVSGRTKMYEFEGQQFKGTWELLVASSLSSSNIKYTNNVTPIEYNWNGNKHLYFPDFYLPDYDLFIEVKGYETERDYCKWNALSNLVIIKRPEIDDIRNGKLISEYLENKIL
jgi:hypothetical protein